MTDEIMTEHDARLIEAGELTTLAAVLPWIADDNLLALRGWLRHPGRFPHLAPAMRLQRAALLDQTCRRLVAFGVGDVRYFEGAGDMIPTAPDDASELVE